MFQKTFSKGMALVLLSSFALNLGCTNSAKKSETTGSYSGHGVDSVSPELIKKFAPPTLAPSLDAKIQSILDLKSPGSGFMTQDRKKYFFNWSITGINQIWRLDGPGQFPIQMTGGSQPTYLSGVTPDGKWLVLARDTGGDEDDGLYLQSTSGGPVTEIFRKKKVQASLNFISDDSKHLYFRANDTDPKSFWIYRYDIHTKNSELLHKGDGYWQVADERDGKILLGRAVSNVASEYFELNLATKQLTPIIGQNEKEDYEIMYGAAAGEILVLTSKGQDFKRLYSLKDGKLKPVSPAQDFEVESFTIDRSRKKIAYTLNENGYGRLRILDAKSYQSMEAPQFKDADQVEHQQFTKDGQALVIRVNRHNSPRQTYYFDWNTRKTIQWILTSMPETDSAKFVSAKLEYYLAQDGTKIPMFVRTPKACEASIAKSPCPVVIQFHGGPEAQTQPGYSLVAQLFVDEGFIYAEPNVRGSTGYGKKWLDSDNGPKRLQVITDIADAAAHFKNKYTLNGIAPKLGVMGASYGGYSTLVAMTRFAGSYDAGVASVGMSSLLTFLNNTAPYRRALRTPEYGDPEKDKEALIELSPVTHLPKVKAPVLVIQGVNDPRVPAGEAIQMFDAMKAKGLDSQLILFADEGHGISKRSNQALNLGNTLLFFKKHLQGSTF